MKKLLIICLALIFVIPAIFATQRYNNNINSIIPYPFIIDPAMNRENDTSAPILIVGDKMAKRVGTFKNYLAEQISGDIEKPIQINVIAQDDEGLHRTLDKIKKLGQLPLVIIYLGNLDNNLEEIFYNKDIEEIGKNLELYYHPLYQSAMLVVPWLSRFIYTPVHYKKISKNIQKDENLDKGIDPLYQKRMELNFKLYEAMVNDFFKYTLKNNSIVIPVTTPLNLRIKPKKSCYGSFDESTKEDYDQVIKLLKAKDYKGAYNLSKDLVLINQAHASTQYLHALASERINLFSEAQKYYELAIAYDCGNPHRGNPVYNAILKTNANKNGLVYLDFHQYLADQSKVNYTFIDEVYPQDLYLEKLAQMLAIRVKKLLKLQ